MPARRRLPILRLAGKASTRRRPVNSALGRALNPARCFPSLRPAPQGSSSLLGKSSLPVLLLPTTRFGRACKTRVLPSLRLSAASGASRLPRSASPRPSCRPVVAGASRRRAAPRCQFVGHAALESTGSLLQRRAGGAHGRRLLKSTDGALGYAPGEAPSNLRRHPSGQRPSTRPNWSFNRSANGMAPGPRGARCLSSAARARRHAVVARLTLR